VNILPTSNLEFNLQWQ